MSTNPRTDRAQEVPNTPPTRSKPARSPFDGVILRVHQYRADQYGPDRIVLQFRRSSGVESPFTEIEVYGVLADGILEQVLGAVEEDGANLSVSGRRR
jgi:hypothetical protein